MNAGTFSTLAAPLRVPAFRALWSANTISNAGTLMQSVGAAWLMTTLTNSTTLVGLVQTAATLPVFLIGLLAGAMADTVDRKSLLFWSQLWMLMMALILGILTLLGLTTPLVLLATTFALGMGSAISLPAWQATVQDIVPRESVAAAVALNSISFNLARAVGPAIGGLLVAATGPATAFLVNAASFLAVLGAVFSWKPAPKVASGLSEDIFSAIRAGFRYLLHAKRLQAPIIRAAVFNLFAATVWPLLPLFSRDVLHTDATGYGLLLAAFGLGSILSALIVPRLRTTVALDRLLIMGTLLGAFAYVGVSLAHHFLMAAVMLFFVGMSWVGVLINFNVAVQTAVPAWVRGRALAFYLLSFQGVLALSGFVWGSLAGMIGISHCFAVAAIGLFVGLVMVRVFPLSLNDDIDLTPSVHWPDSHNSITMDPSDGPVLVTVDFEIDPEDEAGFRAAMREVRELRLRDGARRWRLYKDSTNPRHYTEFFAVDSWGEHLRQHERKTVADRAIEELALAYHRGPESPKVTHQLRLED